MKISYMLNLPNDTSGLYVCSEEVCESPFDDIEKIQTGTCRSKEYGDVILTDVKFCIPGLTECIYRGCMERIAREVYQLRINENKYEVVFVFDKREENNIQLHIEIESQVIENENFEIRYDKSLEQLKLALKERLKKDWALCTWLVDDQSEMLCANLYHRFFRIENQVRAFANKVLIQHLGHNWLEQPGLEKYRDSVSSMEKSFKQIVPQYANTDATLISMTLETLSEIMLKAVAYNENTVLTSMDISKLYQFLNKRNEDGAKQFVQKKREIKVKIWDEIFVQYISNPEQFKKQLSQFIKSRNHIAHNKLLTFMAFKQIHDELTDFETTITKATESFEEKNASNELLDTWMSEQEQENYDAEYEEQYWRDRIIGETGIEIRDTEEIYDLFYETVMNLYENLADKYHYDSCFDVSDVNQPADDGSTKICTVISNASNDELDIIVSMLLDDDMDSTSYLNIEAKHNEKLVAKAECIYHNGEGHEGDEGLCVADSDSEYDDSQIHDFLEDVIAYINDELNSLLKELFAREYECGRHGGENPVADFACAECGKDGVSVLEDFLPIGKCCYCGYENEVYICESCGLVHDEMGGDQHLCNGCMPKDDD